MQTESELSSNGRQAKSRPTKNPAADATPSGTTHEFQSFVADMEDLLKASTSLTGDELARAKANIYARVARARASVGEMSEAVSARVRNTAKVADGYVREQPWQTLGITAAVGLLIGFLLGRRGQ
jgi:ElaB/YqjD/DUF883 family membrane-anchored ribosome-binding protein